MKLSARPSPMGMRVRLVLVLLGTLLVAQLATMALFLNERQQAIRANVAEEAAARTVALAEELDALPPDELRSAIGATRSRFLRPWVARQPAVDSEDATPLAPLAHAVATQMGVPDRPLRIAIATRSRRAAASAENGGQDSGLPEPSPWWRLGRATRAELLLSTPLADGRWLNSRVRVRPPPLQWAWPALISFLFAALGVGVIAWHSVGVVLRPINALAQAAERLGRGKRPEPVTVSGTPETRALADAFNRMADRVTRLLDDRARTLAAIGHDLRSPVTAMRLRVEMVEEEETRERLEVCLDEIQDLVEAALALSRGAGVEEPRVGLDLRVMLIGLVEEALEAGGQATLNAPETVVAEVHPHAFRRALRNIIENAVRYGGTARISLRSEPDLIRIEIEDDGPGIPNEDRNRVFEPFLRLEGSRSRDTGGTGLGLAIAKAAIEASGGSITLEDADGGGLRVIVSLTR